MAPIVDSTLSQSDRERLRVDVLDLLAAARPDWRSTVEFGESLGLNSFQRSAYLWPLLNRLARDREIERTWRGGYRTVFWRVIE